jgi:colanic acid biosynthesis glycosyl transferase WcaI
MLSSLPVMLAQILWRPDAIFTVMPTLLCGPATLAVARLTGASTWLHVQDFEVDNAFDLGILPAQGFIRLLALAFEKFFMGCFDRVSTISPNMVQRAIDKGVDKKHVLLFPNWVDTDAIHPQPRPNSLRRELGISEEDVVLLYSGNMGMKQGMEILPTLARHFASEPHVKFLFCGDGAFRPQLEQLVSGLANVMLLPLQPVERLNDLLNTADIHLLPQRAEAADLVMPSKLTGMLASGRPVIATAAPDTQVAHVVEGRGIAVPVQDMDAIYAAVRHLVNHPAERRSMGEAARAYAVECLGSQHVLARFTAEMEKLAVQHPD